MFREAVVMLVGISLFVLMLIVFPYNNARMAAEERHHRELVEAVEQMTAICEVRHE